MTKEPTSQLSGRMCNNPKFQRMLGATNPDDAAARVRQHCGIASRRELDWDERAAGLFHELRRQFAYGEAA